MPTNKLSQELQEAGYEGVKGKSFVLDSLKEELEKKGYDCFRKFFDSEEEPTMYRLVAWSSKSKRIRVLKSEDKKEYYAIIKLYIDLLTKKKFKRRKKHKKK